jgi:hypothetical protein
MREVFHQMNSDAFHRILVRMLKNRVRLLAHEHPHWSWSEARHALAVDAEADDLELEETLPQHVRLWWVQSLSEAHPNSSGVVLDSSASLDRRLRQIPSRERGGVRVAEEDPDDYLP